MTRSKRRTWTHPKTVEKVAYHEAGHVVVGLVLGIGNLVSVSIQPNEEANRLGHTHWQLPEWMSFQKMYYYIVMCHAGLQAVRLIRKRLTIVEYLGAMDDLADAQQWAAELGEDNPALQINLPPEQYATMLLEQHRAGLDAVAKALIEKRELKGDEAIALWDAAIRQSLGMEEA
jgi:hypothetical protein